MHVLLPLATHPGKCVCSSVCHRRHHRRPAALATAIVAPTAVAAPITPTTNSPAAIDCACISTATLNASAIPATAIGIAAVTTAAVIRAAGIACAAAATSAVPQDYVSTLRPRIRPSTAGSVQRELCISRRLGSGYWGSVALTRRQPVPKLSLRPVAPLLVILRQ